MKYVSVLLVGLTLSGCTHDQETAAMFGLLVGAAILSATMEDDQDRERHRRHGHWRGDNDRERYGHRERRRH